MSFSLNKSINERVFSLEIGTVNKEVPDLSNTCAPLSVIIAQSIPASCKGGRASFRLRPVATMNSTPWDWAYLIAWIFSSEICMLAFSKVPSISEAINFIIVSVLSYGFYRIVYHKSAIIFENVFLFLRQIFCYP